MGVEFDFSGWATKNGLKCSDGRVIMHDAFKDNDGQTVPLVWNHQHDNSSNVLGHALLENRDEGVYAYCSFNDSEAGQNAKLLVKHGDVNALSIYANQLKQRGSEVIHGAIREVSLVLAGANPGALIDNLYFAHSEEVIDDEAIIYTGENLVLSHSDKEDEEPEEKEESKKDEEEESEDEPENDEESENSDDDLKHSDDSKTVKEVFDSLNDDQKTVVYAVIAELMNEEETANKDSEGGNEDMKHNVFDNEQQQDAVLMHNAMNEIIKDAKLKGSLRESFLAHADEYGIKDIEWLFPDAKNVVEGGAPGFIKRNPDEWVSVVMNGVHHTPFSRIKMMFADLREDDARAKGYAQKGKLKKEEVFGLIKRTVEPTTIYKKQKLDRDDIIDITDFDVVSWLKGEMRMMLDEEIARAILFGDGRSTVSEDKIKETNIIPACSDAALYTIKETLPSSYTAKDVIKAAVKGQNDYEGSGNTTMFVANTTVTDMLLLEDGMQHRLYKDVNELALACSVNRIVKVPASIIPKGVVALIVDLKDYNVGADKGGSINMFDDFDIDYNQQKYLIETRCSGALYRPFSSVVIKEADASSAAG